MEIIFTRLYKIDLFNESIIPQLQLQDNPNLKNYVVELIGMISGKETERAFAFKSEFTEVRSLLDRIIKDNEYNASCLAIANRLLEKEILAQKKVERLSVEIHKGMLIISLIQMTDEAQKLIISKADYSEFLEEISGNVTSGLPIKKKIYKAFICDLVDQGNITKISIFDSNAILATYWWKEFIELVSLRTDEHNTQRSFDAIESKILNPIKKKHKSDYLHLWNSTIRYFRASEEFNIEDYIKNGIGENYTPQDDNLNIGELLQKIRELPSKFNFDFRFGIIKKLITKRYKNNIYLTPQIDLVIKQDIPDLENTIKPYTEGDGTKFIMIRSDEGYDYAIQKLNHE